LSSVPQQNTGLASFSSVTMDGGALDGELTPTYAVGEDIGIGFEIEFVGVTEEVVAAVSVYGSDGMWLIGQSSLEAGVSFKGAVPGERMRGRVALTNNRLAPGNYYVSLGAFSPDLALCYALTDLSVRFCVRGKNPSWGRFVHECSWFLE